MEYVQQKLFDVEPDPARVLSRDQAEAVRKAAAIGAGAAAAVARNRQDPPPPGREQAGKSRGEDYETSTAAALRAPGRRGSQRVRIGQAFYAAGDDGLTDEAAAIAAGIPPQSSPWKRCGELREFGYLQSLASLCDCDDPVGVTRKTTMGSDAVVWVMDAAARAAWDAHLEEPDA